MASEMALAGATMAPRAKAVAAAVITILRNTIRPTFSCFTGRQVAEQHLSYLLQTKKDRRLRLLSIKR
ncbi:hypothetical protein C0580_02640 [Candidatus Parcubacteria bacterium]|nr:MAG: hypothetical protein C0580_02640 [Candidatus Parcubacteria bacterium]